MKHVALDEARKELHEAGLTAPPVPAEFVSTFRKFGPWQWGTCEIDQGDMYFFKPFWTMWAGGLPEDYMAFSHGGHGANSYFLTYFLVYRPIAVLFQTGWGGGYMDANDAAADFARLCALSAHVVDEATRVRQTSIRISRLAVIQCSEARGVGLFRVVDATPTESVIADNERPERPEVLFQRAEAWLRGISERH
jgi:hypothetical protein